MLDLLPFLDLNVPSKACLNRLLSAQLAGKWVWNDTVWSSAGTCFWISRLLARTAQISLILWHLTITTIFHKCLTIISPQEVLILPQMYGRQNVAGTGCLKIVFLSQCIVDCSTKISRKLLEAAVEKPRIAVQLVFMYPDKPSQLSGSPNS